MAKKQQIILTHGTGMPSPDVIKGLKLGEVLVQHAATAEEAALHTVLTEGENAELVSFPSKTYVDNAIANVDATTINKNIEAVVTRVTTLETTTVPAAEKNAKDYADTQVANEKTLRENADKEINEKIGDGFNKDNTIASAISTLTSTNNATHEALQAAIDEKVAQSVYEAEIETIEGNIEAITGVLSGYETEGSVKDAVDSKVAQSEYDDQVSDFESRISANETALANLENTFYTESEIDDKVNTINADIAKAKTTLTEASDVTEGVKVSVVTPSAADGHVEYKVEAVGLATSEELSAAKDRISVIEGAYAGRSMKEVADVAVKELEDLLYGEGASNAIDTLQDVINWIDNDQTGAAKIVSDVENLQKTTAGYDGENTIKKAVDAIDERVSDIEEDYLTSTDKTTLEGKITNEETARKEADKEINDKIGGTYDATNTVAKAIADEENARKEAVQGVQNQIDSLENKFYTETEIDSKIQTINADIAKAKTTLTEASDVTEGVKVVKDATDPNNYTVTAVGLATSEELSAAKDRITTLEGDVVKSVSITNSDTNKITASVSNNTLTFNFDTMVIDGGEY